MTGNAKGRLTARQTVPKQKIKPPAQRPTRKEGK